MLGAGREENWKWSHTKSQVWLLGSKEGNIKKDQVLLKLDNWAWVINLLPQCNCTQVVNDGIIQSSTALCNFPFLCVSIDIIHQWSKLNEVYHIFLFLYKVDHQSCCSGSECSPHTQICTMLPSLAQGGWRLQKTEIASLQQLVGPGRIACR